MQAVENSLVGVDGSGKFTYCDFGAADGGMASELAKSVVDRVNSSDNRDVHVVFEDQAANDFSSLFAKFQHQIADSSAMENIFVSAVGRSFYKQCLPEESVDLALCSTAAHWLDINEHTDPETIEKVCRSNNYYRLMKINVLKVDQFLLFCVPAMVEKYSREHSFKA